MSTVASNPEPNLGSIFLSSCTCTFYDFLVLGISSCVFCLLLFWDAVHFDGFMDGGKPLYHTFWDLFFSLLRGWWRRTLITNSDGRHTE